LSEKLPGRLPGKISGLMERTTNKSSIIKVSTCLMSMFKARNIRTDLHVFFFFCCMLADDADNLIGRRN